MPYIHTIHIVQSIYKSELRIKYSRKPTAGSMRIRTSSITCKQVGWNKHSGYPDTHSFLLSISDNCLPIVQHTCDDIFSVLYRRLKSFQRRVSEELKIKFPLKDCLIKISFKWYFKRPFFNYISFIFICA